MLCEVYSAIIMGNDNKNKTHKKNDMDIAGIKQLHNDFRRENKSKKIQGVKNYSGKLASQLVVKQNSEMKCNDNGSRRDADRFSVEFSITNRSANTDWCFHEITAMYEYLNDENGSGSGIDDSISGGNGITLQLFDNTRNFYAEPNVSMPFTLNEGKDETRHVKLEMFVPFAKNGDLVLSGYWHGRSFLARFEPILFKTKLTEMDNGDCVIDTFYCHNESIEYHLWWKRMYLI